MMQCNLQAIAPDRTDRKPLDHGRQIGEREMAVGEHRTRGPRR
jgi:hypothetical protein